MIEGQSPTVKWQPNPEGRRSIEEAVAIAKKYGVIIPDDVVFYVDEYSKLNNRTTARGPTFKERPHNHLVNWQEFYNVENKIPFFIRPDILESDEAIVAVMAHELFELKKLRLIMKKRDKTIEFLSAETCPDNPGNFHDQAWTFADELVKKMRKQKDKESRS